LATSSTASPAIDQPAGPHPLHNAYLSAVAGTMAAAIDSLHNNLHKGSLLVDPYWVGFYVTNYKDGFRRRALLGSLCRLISPHGISVIAINIVALLAAFFLAVLLIRSFIRISATPSYQTSLFTFAFFASALTAMFFETLGDTLQIAFVVFLLAILLATRCNAGVKVRLFLGLCLVCIGFFIHEASLFFLTPALPFLIRRRPRLNDFIIPSLLLAALLGLAVHWSHVQPDLTYRAILVPRQSQLTQAFDTPDFKTLQQSELQDDFGSIHNIIRFASRCLRLLVLLFAGVVAVSNCLSRKHFDHFLLALGCILLYNAPLWLIAHDWGRFLAYSFFFAIVVTALSKYVPSTISEPEGTPGLLSRVANTIRRVGSFDMISLAILFVLFDSEMLESRVTGIGVRAFVSFLVLFALAVFAAVSGQQRQAAND
jgi:hypothetical protein